jgi:hypothetical protein
MDIGVREQLSLRAARPRCSDAVLPAGNATNGDELEQQLEHNGQSSNIPFKTSLE